MAALRNLLRQSSVLLLIAATSTGLRCQTLETDLDKAIASAAGSRKHLLVFVTGSDWNSASESLVNEQLANKRLIGPLAAKHVLAHLDLRIRDKSDSSVRTRAKVSEALRYLGIWRHDQVPCVILRDDKGRNRGRSILLPGKLDRTISMIHDLEDAAEVAARPATDAERAHNHLVQAWSLFQQKKVAEARAEAMEGVKHDPRNAELWDVLATTASTQAKTFELREARTAVAVTEIPETGPERALALLSIRWSRLGAANAEQKRELEAIFCFREAMALDRSNFEAGLASARLCLQLKDLPGALRDADEVLRRNFGNAEALRIRRKCLPQKTLEGR